MNEEEHLRWSNVIHHLVPNKLTRSNLCTSLDTKFTILPEDIFPIVVWLSLSIYGRTGHVATV